MLARTRGIRLMVAKGWGKRRKLEAEERERAGNISRALNRPHAAFTMNKFDSAAF